MADWPLDNVAAPPFLNSYSRFSGIRELRAANGAAIASAAVAWGTANTAKYYPITIPFAYNVRRFWWINGSTIAGTRDVGIYTPSGSRIGSTGPITAAGASSIQYANPTGGNFKLLPGDYFLAFLPTVTAAAVWGATTSAALQRFAGIYDQAVGSGTLPATATFAIAGTAGVNMCGFTWTDTGH